MTDCALNGSLVSDVAVVSDVVSTPVVQDVVLGAVVQDVVLTNTVAEVLPLPEVVIPVVAVTKTRKPRAPKQVIRGRGRPNVYVGDTLKLIVALCRCCLNVSLVREVLTSSSKKQAEQVAQRKSLGFEKPSTISLPMLGKYAKEAGIELPKGRPSFKTEAKQKKQLAAYIAKRTAKTAEKTAA